MTSQSPSHLGRCYWEPTAAIKVSNPLLLVRYFRLCECTYFRSLMERSEESITLRQVLSWFCGTWLCSELLQDRGGGTQTTRNKQHQAPYPTSQLHNAQYILYLIERCNCSGSLGHSEIINEYWYDYEKLVGRFALQAVAKVQNASIRRVFPKRTLGLPYMQYGLQLQGFVSRQVSLPRSRGAWFHPIAFPFRHKSVNK